MGESPLRGAARAAPARVASGPPADSRALKGKRGLQRVWNAFHYSFDGLRSAWREEDAFRQELILAVLMVPAAVLLPLELVERLLMIGSVMMVLIVELLNSAVEAAIDRQSYEINPLAKQAKDLGSAAVLLSLLTTAGIWGAILWARFA
jgi:diacylglycerol kinase (ATP)